MKWLGWRTARGGFTGWTFFVRVGVGALDGSVGSVLAAWSVRESAIRNGWGADCLGWWINGMGLLFFSWAYAVWDRGALGRRNIGEFGTS